MKLTARATLQIQKQHEEVFEAIVNPEHMTQYFISECSGRMETGKDIVWKFPEFNDKYPVTQVNVSSHDSVSFVWDQDTVVRIWLEAQADNSTVVRITEGEKVLNDENLKWTIGNTEGWANFLACLKAYLEYGVQLRTGAFDFMKSNS
ncbi:SRPBCC domain-containing protein [Marnyiella aurantia]|uniref:SRPBCC domain-containing protein n=1 Tax=Marnyiella aurantia TaxID=2758037 RepID=A0A7D7LM18_9FLAO|nr:SRPBCC domain-containing protein [Marnyiella aurantia]MBA5246576.1 SRPBCC domain-containing protein [Marnyiella aurantia]QMS98064.1 SRPBCC domain-containing protein [Marnyiella aurantia]